MKKKWQKKKKKEKGKEKTIKEQRKEKVILFQKLSEHVVLCHTKLNLVTLEFVNIND